MNEIFISYRRSDSGEFTNQLVEQLEESLGEHRVFRDLESIAPGTNFRDVIDGALAQCSVCLVVIGKNWFESREPGGRRIDDPEDWVHMEIATALSLGILVVPVLIDDQEMPGTRDLPAPLGQLALRNAHRVRGVPDRKGDIQTLAESLRWKIRRDSSLPGAGILAFCFTLFFLGGLSLALPYLVFTSEPWQLEFGQLHHPFKVFGLTVVKENGPKLGWVVELGRTLVLMLAATALLGVGFPREYRQLLGREPVDPGRREWLAAARVIVAILFVLEAALVLIYHLHLGPEQLANSARWKAFSHSCPDKDHSLSQYRQLFSAPFASLLIYSSINVLIIGVSLAATIVFAFGMDYLDLRRDFAGLNRELAKAHDRPPGPTSDRLTLAFQSLAATIAEKFNRYVFAIFWMTILIAYELWIGRITVSDVGGLGMSFLYFILGAVIAFPAIFISAYWMNYGSSGGSERRSRTDASRCAVMN